MSITALAKKQLYEPDDSDVANPTIGEVRIAPGEPDYSRHGWRSMGPSFSGLSYSSSAPMPKDVQAATLGTSMVEKGLGWERICPFHVGTGHGALTS